MKQLALSFLFVAALLLGTFTAAGAPMYPTVTTQSVTSINVTTSTGNGNITSLGGSNPTQYGVEWSASSGPTVSLSTKTTQGAIASTGAFTSSITGLSSSTLYYVKAYATNSAGTSYGVEVTFTTSESTNLLSNPGAELDYASWTVTNGNPNYGWGITGSAYSGSKAWVSSYDKLGLAITKTIIENYKGEIRCESMPGKTIFLMKFQLLFS